MALLVPLAGSTLCCKRPGCILSQVLRFIIYIPGNRLGQYNGEKIKSQKIKLYFERQKQ